MLIQKIKKRNGDTVDFMPKKISEAIGRAMVAVNGKVNPLHTDELLSAILKQLEARYGKERIPDVEGVQDIVERTLMEYRYFDIAKAYILYRERQKQLRERHEEIKKKIEARALYVVKRNGARELFNPQKLHRYFLYACNGYEGVVDIDSLVKQAEASIYDGIATAEIAQLAVMTVKSLIEKDPVYMAITNNIFFANLYREALGEKFSHETLEEQYQNAFVKNIKKSVEIGRLDPQMLNFDLPALSKKLKLNRDQLLSYRGLQTLYDRYFIYDRENNQRLETPQMFWMRVAMGIALNEKEDEKEKWTVEFYEVLSSLRFINSTPTLFHAGTLHPQLSSCYLTTVEDSLDHIFKCIGDNAQLSKWSGGLGNDWTNIRATGALIKGTNVESQGVIPFLKIANDTTVAINRSGKRRGATCAYLETWHLDIEDFLDLRRNTGDERRRTHDMNTAHWIPDLFMKRVEQDQEWTLFSPDDTPDLHHTYGKKFEARYIAYEKKAERGEIRLFKKVKASDLWKKMITRLFETGHPWITFKDACNVRSPQDHAGIIHSSNLCTEITLNTSKEETAVCNLGSLNLPMHIVNGEFSHELIKQTVETAMRMLDNIIDLNFYPTEEAKYSNIKHRPVGLGIMGFQDALYILDINFESAQMLECADQSMEVISYYAIVASTKLAKERGAYETFKGSKWDRGILPLDTLDLLEQERGVQIDVPRTATLNWDRVKEAIKKYGMRNSNCMAIAPTATISNICDCFPSIEPIYQNLYVKSNMSGEFTIMNPYLVNDLKAIGLWDLSTLDDLKFNDGSIQSIKSIPQKIKDKYKEAFEIKPEYLIEAAARRGKWIDQSQSLNIFLNTTNGKQISDVYLLAWKRGIKTTYYLRTRAASGVEKSTIDINRDKQIKNPAPEEISYSMKLNRSTPPPPDPILIHQNGSIEINLTETTAEKVNADGVCNLQTEDCEACQ